MAYKYDAAREAGVTDVEIIDHLSDKHKYNLTGARKAGVPDSDILKELLGRDDKPAAAAKPKLKATDPVPMPASEDEKQTSFWEKAGGFFKGMKEHFEEHRLPVLKAMQKDVVLPMFRPEGYQPAVAAWMVNNGLEEKLAEEAQKENPDFNGVLKQNLTDNSVDVALTSFDLVALGVAPGINTGLRELTAKVGLNKALSFIAVHGLEGAGFFSTYNGIEAAVQGESARRVGVQMAKGAAIGFPAGVLLGTVFKIPAASKAGYRFAKGLGEEGLTPFMRRVEKEAGKLIELRVNGVAAREIAAESAEMSQAARLLLEDTVTELRSVFPDMAVKEVERKARQFAFEGVPLEEVIDPNFMHGVKAAAPEPGTPWATANAGKEALPSFEIEAGNDAPFRQWFVNLNKTRNKHKFGPAVEVKPVEEYLQPGTKIFSSESGEVGAAVTAEGDLVSVFKLPGSKEDINPLLHEAAKVAKTLDGFDINGKLPDLYAKHGFRPSGRMKFDPEFAPEGWTQEMGTPDVVFMVKDPAGRSGLPKIRPEKGGYAAIKEEVPIVGDYEQAVAGQRSAASMVEVPTVKPEPPPPARNQPDEQPAVSAAQEGSAGSDSEAYAQFREAVGGIGDDSYAAFDEAMQGAMRAVSEPIVIEERARTVRFFGSETLRKFTRAEKVNPLTLRDWARRGELQLKGLFEAEPGRTPLVKNVLFEMRVQVGAARQKANHITRKRVTDLLQGDRTAVGQKSAWLSDYMYNLDRVATLRSKGAAQGEMFQGKALTGPGGTTMREFEEEVLKTAAPVLDHPDILQAQKAIRSVLDELHATGIERGWYETGQYRQEYLPTQRLTEIAQGLADDFAGTDIGRRLASQLTRNSAGEVQKSNIIELLNTTLEAHFRKAAEDDGFAMLRQNPTINLTRFFETDPNRIIPKNLAKFTPGPGMPGYVATDAMAAAEAGVNEALHSASRWHQGAYIMPKEVVESLTNFYKRTGDPSERALYRAAQWFTRQLTLYSPTNTPLNAESDAPLAAIVGMAGEKMQFRSFMRFFPTAVRESYKGAFAGRKSAVLKKLAGEGEPKIFERAELEGLSGQSFITSVGGKTLPAHLEAAMAQADTPHRINVVKELIQDWVRVRVAVESTPRIAAGLAREAEVQGVGTGIRSLSGTGKKQIDQFLVREGAAAEQTGVRELTEPARNEFARVGQSVSLPFGAGNPQASRSPISVLLAPFWRWTGLAIARSIQTATTSGSRVRGIAALTAPVAATALWNLQNEEFKKVEYSLSEYDRTHMHVIVPNPLRPGEPYRDSNDRPIVWRMRFWVPEEIMGFMGLGNLPARGLDLATGYTEPDEFVKEVGREFGHNVASLPAAVTQTRALLTNRSSLTGQDMESFQRTESTVPLLFHISKLREVQKNEGGAAAFLQIVPRVLGFRPAGSKKGQMDNKTLRIAAQIRDAEMKLNYAASIGNQSQQDFFMKKIIRLGERMARLQKARVGDRDIPPNIPEGDDDVR